MPDTSVTITPQVLSPRRTLGQRLDRVYHGFAIVGPSPTPGLRFTLEGLSLETVAPTVVLFQPRQSDNRDNNWGDEFAVQVIETAQDHILGRVLRLDLNVGWLATTSGATHSEAMIYHWAVIGVRSAARPRPPVTRPGPRPLTKAA